jgi:hypothetical protein
MQRPPAAPPALLVLLVIVSLLGQRVAARTRHLTEASASTLLGLATGGVLLVVRSAGGPGAQFAERMLEFNAGGFFTWVPAPPPVC